MAPEPSANPKYVLRYFNVRGLAEPIRLLFAYGNIAYEDVRCEHADWPEIKRTMPMEQMPVLDIDGIRTYQSGAMTRYVAKLVGLVGANPWEDFQIDMAVETVNDLRMKIVPAFYESNEKLKAEKMAKIKSEVIPFYAKKIEERVQANGGYLALGKLTWADVYLVAHLESTNFMAGCNIIENCPNVQKLVEKVSANEGISKWLKTRPVTER